MTVKNEKKAEIAKAEITQTNIGAFELKVTISISKKKRPFPLGWAGAT
jgi:hypothetical protein